MMRPCPANPLDLLWSPSYRPRAMGTSAKWLPRVNLLVGLLLIGYALSDHPWYGGYPGFGGLQVVIAGIGGLVVLACFVLALAWNQRILLVLCSLLFSLAGLEIGLELLFSAQYRPPYEYHDRYIFQLRPSRTFQRTLLAANGGQTIVSRTNSEGFRGDELAPVGESTRVVVYGDSFIHATFSPQEETFVQQLEDSLVDELKRPVEVINAGVSAYGPDQVLLRLQDELPKLKPDLVVVAVFAGNDYSDLIRNKLFKLDSEGRLIDNPFELEAGMRTALNLNHRGSILKRVARRASKALKARPSGAPQPSAKNNAMALVDSALATDEFEFEDYVVRGNNIVTNTHMDSTNVDISLHPESASARYKIKLMARVLEKIEAVASRASVPVVFMFIPHPMDVVGRHSTGEVDLVRYPEYRRTALTEALDVMATDAKLHSVNLFELFEQNNPGKLYFGAGDNHWNAAGQALAARAVSDYLIRENLLPEVASTPSR